LPLVGGLNGRIISRPGDEAGLKTCSGGDPTRTGDAAVANEFDPPRSDIRQRRSGTSIQLTHSSDDCILANSECHRLDVIDALYFSFS
jgi:hypothetical protein